MIVIKIKYFLVLLALVLVVSSCNTSQFQKLDLNNSYYQLTFGKNVPLKLKQQAKSVFAKNQQSTSIQNNNIEINNYLFKKYDVYAGNALRALETEISISIDIKVKKNDKFISKTIVSTKRFNSIELNPLAEKEMLKFALKVSNDSRSISASDFSNLTKHGFSDDDIWDIAGITAFFEEQLINDLIDKLIIEVKLIDL